MGKIIVVTSGKGGVGKSSVSCGVAQALARQGKSVLLIDADVELRSLDVMLGTSELTIYHWGDLIEENCSKDQAILKPFEQLPLWILSSPTSMDLFPSEVKFAQMCKELSNEYDFVFVDCPAGLGRGFSLATSAADEALIVVTPDPVCIRSASITAKHLFDKDIVPKMILNRFRTFPIIGKSMPNIDDAIDQTSVMLIGVVPEDKKVSYSAAKGCPLPVNCKAFKAFSRIAKRIDGDQVPLKNFLV